jgi:hypothetical protein
MNKIARGILAEYCPFNAEIRESVKNQPIFAEAMTRNTRERAVKLKELDLRCRMLQKEGIEIPEEISTTLVYYRDK